MRILIIQGSPRKHGNTVFLVEKFKEGASSAGAEIDEFSIGKGNIHSCIDCDLCNEDGICRTKDDFQPLVEKVKAADGLCIATPVNCCNVPAQVKAWMDRTNSLTYPGYNFPFDGKKAVLLITSGYPIPRRELPHVPIHLVQKIDGRIKLGTLDSLRCALDPFRPFDATIDTLRALYNWCVFMGIDVVGTAEITSLGHNPNTVRDRNEDLDKAYQLGEMLAQSLSPGWDPREYFMKQGWWSASDQR